MPSEFEVWHFVPASDSHTVVEFNELRSLYDAMS